MLELGLQVLNEIYIFNFISESKFSRSLVTHCHLKRLTHTAVNLSGGDVTAGGLETYRNNALCALCLNMEMADKIIIPER